MFKKLTKQEYQDLFNKTLFSTFFHNPEWFEFLEKEFKWLKFEHYLYKDEALISFGRVGKKLISLPFCEYGGLLPLKQGINFEEFKKSVLSEFGEDIKIKFHPRILDYFILNPKSCLLTPSVFTYWIENLSDVSERELMNSFRKTLRHEIRNAQQHNLEIRRCSDLKELLKFYGLYAANLKRKKTVPYPFSVVKFLWNYPNLRMKSESTNTELLLAINNRGKVIAGSLFLHYDGFVHYFLSASDYKYRNLGANYLILWEKIKSLIGKDVIFDLGASPKGSALEIFKRGWGGKEYPIYQIGIKRSEEGLRSSKLRNIWGLLPNFAIKKLSRYLIKYRI